MFSALSRIAGSEIVGTRVYLLVHSAIASNSLAEPPSRSSQCEILDTDPPPPLLSLCISKQLKNVIF